MAVVIVDNLIGPIDVARSAGLNVGMAEAARNGSQPEDKPPVKIVQLGGSFEAFGMVIDYLSRIAPFVRYDVGSFAVAVRRQLRRGHHLAALQGTTLVGYAGWMLTSRTIAEVWLKSEGVLQPVAKGNADAAALTLVTSDDRRVLLRLIRGARKLNPGVRVFFKRQYAQGNREARKASVANLRFDSD